MPAKKVSENFSVVAPNNNGNSPVPVLQGLPYEVGLDRSLQMAKVADEPAYFSFDVENVQGYTGPVYVRVQPDKTMGEIHDEFNEVTVGLVKLGGLNLSPKSQNHPGASIKSKI